MWSSKEQVEEWLEGCHSRSQETTERIWTEARKFVEQKTFGADEPTYSILVAAYVQARSTLFSTELTTSMLEFVGDAVKDVANK